MFVYQPTYRTLALKKENYEYVISSKSKSLFESKFIPLHDTFLLKIKLFGYKIVIQFNSIHSVLE